MEAVVARVQGEDGKGPGHRQPRLGQRGGLGAQEGGVELVVDRGVGADREVAGPHETRARVLHVLSVGGHEDAAGTQDRHGDGHGPHDRCGARQPGARLTQGQAERQRGTMSPGRGRQDEGRNRQQQGERRGQDGKHHQPQRGAARACRPGDLSRVQRQDGHPQRAERAAHGNHQGADRTHPPGPPLRMAADDRPLLEGPDEVEAGHAAGSRRGGEPAGTRAQEEDEDGLPRRGQDHGPFGHEGTCHAGRRGHAHGPAQQAAEHSRPGSLEGEDAAQVPGPGADGGRQRQGAPVLVGGDDEGRRDQPQQQADGASCGEHHHDDLEGHGGRVDGHRVELGVGGVGGQHLTGDDDGHPHVEALDLLPGHSLGAGDEEVGVDAGRVGPGGGGDPVGQRPGGVRLGADDAGDPEAALVAGQELVNPAVGGVPAGEGRCDEGDLVADVGARALGHGAGDDDVGDVGGRGAVHEPATGREQEVEGAGVGLGERHGGDARGLDPGQVRGAGARSPELTGL